MTTFVFATYFTSTVAINPVIGTHQWGDAMALAGIVVAILSPICGAITDYNGRRKYGLFLFTLLVVMSAALLWYAYPGTNNVNFILSCVVLGTIGTALCMVFYNAMLTKLVPLNYLGRVSGWGWGLGYFGGLTALLIAFSAFVNAKPTWLNTTTFEHIRICGPLVALWAIVFSIPLFLWVPDYAITHVRFFQSIKLGIKDLGVTIKMLFQQKYILIFLVAQMIYIDGLNTLFAFGGIYAAGVFHMTLSDVLLFGIVMNVFAGMGSIIFAWVDDLMGPKWVVLLSLTLLTVFGLGIVLVTSKTLFWILACAISLFVGPVQSSSRSLMAHLVPKEKATELFGFYVLSGKISTFIGPWVFGTMTYYFNSQRAGMGAVMGFFVLGGIILLYVKNTASQI